MSAWIITGLAGIVSLGFSPTAFGSAEIRLVPNNPGPYVGNDPVTVDIYIDNQEDDDLHMYTVQFDFADTSPEIILPGSLTWLLTPPAAGNPSLPTPIWSVTGGLPNIVPANGTILAARIAFRVPAGPGCFVLDVMNRDESNPALGAFITFDNGEGLSTWRAYTSNLSNGALGFPVGVTTTSEVCNRLDDDCDGLIDEDFFVEQFDPIADDEIYVGPDAACIIGAGECEILGSLVCNANSDGLECVSSETSPMPGVEGPYLDLTCYDNLDNDCDDLYDEEDPDCQGPEVCDGLDNDANELVDELWPELGTSCTVGMGVCQQTGEIVCALDLSGPTCNVEPLSTPNSSEGPPGHPHCTDGFDNDCDGLTDLEDPDCQEPEVCDSKDNDGDMMIDEDWSDQLGMSCTVGTGQCENSGEFICNALGTGVTCSVSPGAPSPEGYGCECADGLDNDCDGLTDFADPDCGASSFRARARMPVTCASGSDDCRTWHQVFFDSLNGGPGTTLTGELLVLDGMFNEIATIPVSNGDRVRFRSRQSLGDLLVTTVNQPIDAEMLDTCYTGPTMQFSPYDSTCALLDSDCDDDVDLVDMAELQQHFGEVVIYHDIAAPYLLLRSTATSSLGTVHGYASPVPHIRVYDPDKTIVLVDEADHVVVDTAIPNVNPATLDVKLDGIDVLAALGLNPATDFPGGPYGGSVQLPNGCTADICNLVVDVADGDSMASNSLRMLVENMCCGGHALRIQGQPGMGGTYPNPVPSACIEDDFDDTGISQGFQIEVTSPTDDQIIPAPPVVVMGEVCHGQAITDNLSAPDSVFVNGLAVPITGPVVTPGDGVNTADKYVYSFVTSLAQTDLFDDMVGGNGVAGTVDPGSNVLIAEALDDSANAAYDQVVNGLGQIASEEFFALRATDDPGLVLNITAAGLQTVVEKTLAELYPTLQEQISNTVKDLEGTQFVLETTTKCDPTVTLVPPPSTAVVNLPDLEDFVITVTPANGQVDVSVIVPPASLSAPIKGKCKLKGPLGVCYLSLTVDLTANITINQATLSLTITEADLLAGNPITPTLTIDPNDIAVSVSDVGSKTGCWVGVLANIFTLGVFEGVVDVIVKNKVQDEVANLDISSYLAIPALPPIPIDFLDLDPVNLGGLGVQLALERTAVKITPSGMSVGLSTEFTALDVDPQILLTPGTELTPATLPLPVLPAPAETVTVMLADDAVNSLIFALCQNGLFITQFEDVDTLSARVATVDCVADTNSAEDEGICLAVKGLPCNTASGAAAEERCEAYTYTLGYVNIHGNSPVILHGEVEVAPNFKALSTPDPNTLVAYLRLSQVFVGAVVDRDLDGVVEGDYTAVPTCLLPGHTDQPCELWAGCYDANLEVAMTFSTVDDVPQIDLSLVDLELSKSYGCAGGISTSLAGVDDVIESQAFDIIQQAIDDNLPPLKLDGFDFGGIVNLTDLRLLTHGNQNDPEFEDYLGVTGNIE